MIYFAKSNSIKSEGQSFVLSDPFKFKNLSDPDFVYHVKLMHDSISTSYHAFLYSMSYFMLKTFSSFGEGGRLLDRLFWWGHNNKQLLQTNGDST